MTTHYQKIQALGNRMAENLTIMGVPSQFDEGGLTLADKILEISSGITTGILLYGDKKVAQSGDTVNLSMMVLENGEFQPNTNVILHETILDKTYSDYSHISKSIGDNWVIEGPFENIISSSDTSGTTITAWGNGKLTINVNGNQVYHDSEAGSISKISYINKILSYNNKTVDLTEYNASFNVLSNVKAGRIIVKTAYVLTTDTHGLATHAYTCSGSGLKEFYATSGTFVSGTFSVFDCYRHDDGTISSHNDIWTGITNTDLTREAEYTTIKEKTVGTTATITFTNIPFKNYRIECDVYQVDGTQDEWFITVLKQDYTAITSADAKLGEWKHISLDLTNIAQNSRVRLNTGGSCTELRFKNFMLYPYGDNDVISINASNPVITNLDTTNITGSLFIEGELQKNTNIDVYKNGTKVDTISTGSTGVASYTYTGSGAGATEFQFKYGSILSEIFVVIDGTFFDEGTSENTKWNGALQRSYSDDGTTLTATGNWKVLYAGNPSITFLNPVTVEFDITALTDTPGIRFYHNSTGVSQTITATGHYKFVMGADSVKVYRDGVEIQNWLSALVGQNFTLAWQFSDTTDSITFKNFVVYPI